MTVLLVELGNTKLKWAYWHQGQRTAGVAIEVQPANPSLLHQYWHDLPQPEQVVFASVASQAVTDLVNTWVKQSWQCPLHRVLTSKYQFGVTNGYRKPSQLGVDRWLGLLAARQLTQEPVCVVDCGTATTLDALDQQGQHQGGLILPGLNMMAQALFHNTAIPPVAIDTQATLFADHTAAAIGSGALLATAALIEKQLAALAEHCQQSPDCILTGSAVPQLQPLLSYPTQLKPELLLDGLALFAAGARDER